MRVSPLFGEYSAVSDGKRQNRGRIFRPAPHVGAFLHSEWVLSRIENPSCVLRREKRIVHPLLADGRERAVAGAEDRFVG